MAIRTPLECWYWRLARPGPGINAPAPLDPSIDLTSWQLATGCPSVIQQELLAANLIPNFHIGENERQVQWAGAADWQYRCLFPTPSELEGQQAELVFEGLDTFVEVSLNGETVLESDNMFVEQRVDVRNKLKQQGQENELVLYFESALRAGERLEEKYGKRTSMLRGAKRMHMRKAQYSWGWDWGPILLTAGPWKPVYLECFELRIQDVHIRSRLADDHSSAKVFVDVAVTSRQASGGTMTVTIIDARGTEVAQQSISMAEGASDATAEMTIESPELWWPNGQGEQPLYQAHAIIANSDKELDRRTKTFGIRTIELIQQPLISAPGTTFMFRVNGRPIFAQGGNWVPADNLLPTVTRQRYFDWVRMGALSHLNMIRVWGGGVYESDDFFDACDAHGILVWHDFAFACGDYPTHQTFLDSLAEESRCQLRRMRGRACLALICGGNEDFLLADHNRTPYDPADISGPFLDTPFPQREIYHRLLKDIAAELAPDTPFHANSPWGGSSANDPTVGDIHQWSVWHLEQLPYQDYKKLAGRFVSEFGMHGFPVQRTVDYFTRGATPEQRHPQSRLMDCHNKGHGAHTRIARYLAENFRFDMSNLENFVYSSQLMQSEAYGYALRDWKRMFGGEGHELCAGAIIWQLNDVYPSTSWAYIDYFLRPKPAFYTIRRCFAPITVGSERTPLSRWVDEDVLLERYVPRFELFAHNTTPEDVMCVLELRAYDMHEGRWTDLGATASSDVVLKAGQNTELCAVEPQKAWNEESPIILESTLIDKTSGQLLARHVDWPEPYRYLTWPKSGEVPLSIEVSAIASDSQKSVLDPNCSWDGEVVVSSTSPLKGVWLEPVHDGSETDDGMEPLWEDNLLDLMPGRPITVKVKGLRGRKVRARYMHDWER